MALTTPYPRCVPQTLPPLFPCLFKGGALSGSFQRASLNESLNNNRQLVQSATALMAHLREPGARSRPASTWCSHPNRTHFDGLSLGCRQSHVPGEARVRTAIEVLCAESSRVGAERFRLSRRRCPRCWWRTARRIPRTRRGSRSTARRWCTERGRVRRCPRWRRWCRRCRRSSPERQKREILAATVEAIGRTAIGRDRAPAPGRRHAAPEVPSGGTGESGRSSSPVPAYVIGTFRHRPGAPASRCPRRGRSSRSGGSRSSAGSRPDHELNFIPYAGFRLRAGRTALVC